MNQKVDKMMVFLEKLGGKLEPIAAKLATIKSLMAIKDGFIAIMPLLIVGSFAIVLNNVLLDFSETSLWYSLGIRLDSSVVDALAEFKVVGGFVWQGTLAIVSMVASFTIAYAYAKISGHDGLSAGVLSLGAFMTVQLWSVSAGVESGEFLFAVNPNNLGTVNIITAILVSLFSGSVYSFFVTRKITVKMPDSVPPGVIKAFEALIPGTVIIFSAAILASVLQLYNTQLSEIITSFIAGPLQKIGAEGPIIAYLYVTLSNLLYFFGIHGPNVLAFVEASVLTPASIANADALANGTQATAIFSKGMLDSFVFLGGGGATLGLIIAIFIASKRSSDRAIAKFSLVPGIFNINEPLVFGLPIVMNPILFIPFVIIPPILLTTAWFQITLFESLGLISNIGAVLIPWVSPIGVGAFLAYQNVFVILIAIIQLVLAVIIYLPFVFASNYMKEQDA